MVVIFLGLGATVAVSLPLGPPSSPPNGIRAIDPPSPVNPRNPELFPRSEAVALDTQALANESSVKLSAFGTEVELLLEKRLVVAGLKVTYGSVKNLDDSHVCMLQMGDTYAGMIGGSGFSYVLRPYQEGYVLSEIDGSNLDQSEDDTDPLAPKIDRQFGTDNDTIPPFMSGSKPSKEPVVVDLLVLYSREAQDSAAKEAGVAPNDSIRAVRAMHLEIARAVIIANYAFEQSNLDIMVRPVGIQMANPAGAWETDGSLEMTRDRLGNDAAVSDLRNTLGADLVTMIVERGEECGYAFNYSGPGNDGAGFSVVRRNCAANNFSLAHELGHNLGLRHECEESQQGDGFGFAYVNRYLRRVQTIMAKRKTHVRQPFYSDASRRRGKKSPVNGVSGCGADAVTVLPDVARQVAEFRRRSTGSQPAAAWVR
ncbi:MAG: zinc-dependent metalloprotease family protein [Bacteroidia bacterium]